MVRGLRPRNRIRWALDVGIRTVGDVGAIGHAERLQPTHPGGRANAGRRGRCPLRAGGKPRYAHRGKQMRKGEHLRPPLGSPERGAVAALCAVTEGLRPAWVRRNNVIRQPTQGRARRWGGAWNQRRLSSDGGAPGTVRPTMCGEHFCIAITSFVIQRKGRRGRRPLRGVR